MKEYLTRTFLTALCIDGWRRLLGVVTAGKEVSIMRTYEVRMFVPEVYSFVAKDDADALEKVAALYKEIYAQDFPTWIEPLIQPEDVK